MGADQCVLRGASALIGCQFDYPLLHVVTAVGWFRRPVFGGLFPLPLSENYRYVGNYRGDCRLKINNVQPADAGNYFFSFRTTLGEWISQTSAQLTVKGTYRNEAVSK